MKALEEKRRSEENLTSVFVASKERGENAIETAHAQIDAAQKWSSDEYVRAAIHQTQQLISQLSSKLESIDPKNEPQISALTDGLAACGKHIQIARQEAAVLATEPGQALYRGCAAFATRKGMMPRVKLLKDEEQAIASGLNAGEQFCRCVAFKIGADKAITDEFKFAAATEIKTKDRLIDQQMRVVVGVAWETAPVT